MILNYVKVLKGTDIWIGKDYPQEIQEERRRLITQVKDKVDATTIKKR